MALPQTAGIRVFENRELDATDRISRHISRGGLAVLDAPWEKIIRLRKTLAAKGAGREALRCLMIRPDAATPQPIPGVQALQQDGLLRLDDALFALGALNHPQPVEALGCSVITIHPDVLVPRSQPLIHLLRRAMEQIRPALPPAPAILDMGCGSGVCSLQAAQVFPGATVVAAPARNRMETALNDGGQQTIRRFLEGAPARLNPGGRVIVGYADHSGPKAIANLERFMADAGLRIEARHADRIKTHRSNRAWESIFAYELA